MVAVYVRLIRSGKLSLHDVPPRWRAQVEEALDKAEATDETAWRSAEQFGEGAGHSPEEALDRESE